MDIRAFIIILLIIFLFIYFLIVKWINKRGEKRLSEIAYLYSRSTEDITSGMAGAKAEASDTKSKLESDKSMKSGSGSSKLKGDINKKEKQSTTQKQKLAHSIYTYEGKNMRNYWVCEYCDTENIVAKVKCVVCDMQRQKENTDVL